MEQQQQQQQQLHNLQALRVIRRRILDLDLTVARSLNDVVERRQLTDDLSANDVHAIVNTFDNVVADYFSPERWRPLREALGSPAWPEPEWRLAVQRVDQAIAGISDRRRAIRRSDLLFEKIVLDELGLRCHLIRRAIGGEAGGARELIEEIDYYRQIQLSDQQPQPQQLLRQHQQQQQCQQQQQLQLHQQPQPQQLLRQHQQQQQCQQQQQLQLHQQPQPQQAATAAAVAAAVRFSAKVNVKEFRTRP
ncbi:hypothetical protein BOX15_Mlig002810g1 [Macrostomum lignano]|uniref:Uncharacterized protein n=2 Tax=Macrostomum lignano TaxID=282301 RepID=A0A267F1N9_9PLAT|nr:hypothetical protein BOX15_Mlig002810g2 [Macrostomum lignano]PAA90468.1 hypothetical protein BOX15_Mlig002810g1 [Macrostomum lignano]